MEIRGKKNKRNSDLGDSAGMQHWNYCAVLHSKEQLPSLYQSQGAASTRSGLSWHCCYCQINTHLVAAAIEWNQTPSKTILQELGSVKEGIACHSWSLDPGLTRELMLQRQSKVSFLEKTYIIIYRVTFTWWGKGFFLETKGKDLDLIVKLSILFTSVSI